MVLLRERQSNKKTRADKSEVALQPTDLIHPVNSVHILYLSEE